MSETPRTDAELKLEAFMDGFGIVETIQVEFARQLEAELADKDKQLAETRAEIERLKSHLEDESMRADGMTTAHAEADARNYRLQELIEQMREALIKCQEVFLQYAKIHRAKIPEFRPAIFPDPFVEIEAKVKRNLDMADLCAAALAAERGER